MTYRKQENESNKEAAKAALKHSLEVEGGDALTEPYKLPAAEGRSKNKKLKRPPKK